MSWTLSVKLTKNHTSEKSILVQVMACCLMTSSHYLVQCWPRFVSSYGINRPQWVYTYVPLLCEKVRNSVTILAYIDFMINGTCHSACLMYVGNYISWTVCLMCTRFVLSFYETISVRDYAVNNILLIRVSGAEYIAILLEITKRCQKRNDGAIKTCKWYNKRA